MHFKAPVCLNILYLLVILLCRIVTANLITVTWKVENKVIHIGDTINLTCTVHGVISINQGVTRQWSKGSNLVCHNGKSTNPVKYREYTNKKHFKLEIRNITESDLNCKYQCRYNFNTYTKTLDIHTDNFEYPPTPNTTEFLGMYTHDCLKVELRLKKIFPVPNCTVLIKNSVLYLENGTNHRNGIYFNISYINQFYIARTYSAEVYAVCHLIKTYNVANVTIGITRDTSQEHESFIGFVAVIPAVVMILIVCVVRRYLKASRSVVLSNIDPTTQFSSDKIPNVDGSIEMDSFLTHSTKNKKQE